MFCIKVVCISKTIVVGSISINVGGTLAWQRALITLKSVLEWRGALINIAGGRVTQACANPDN